MQSEREEREEIKKLLKIRRLSVTDDDKDYSIFRNTYNSITEENTEATGSFNKKSSFQDCQDLKNIVKASVEGISELLNNKIFKFPENFEVINEEKEEETKKNTNIQQNIIIKKKNIYDIKQDKDYLKGKINTPQLKNKQSYMNLNYNIANMNNYKTTNTIINTNSTILSKSYQSGFNEIFNKTRNSNSLVETNNNLKLNSKNLLSNDELNTINNMRMSTMSSKSKSNQTTSKIIRINNKKESKKYVIQVNKEENPGKISSLNLNSKQQVNTNIHNNLSYNNMYNLINMIQIYSEYIKSEHIHNLNEDYNQGKHINQFINYNINTSILQSNLFLFKNNPLFYIKEINDMSLKDRLAIKIQRKWRKFKLFKSIIGNLKKTENFNKRVNVDDVILSSLYKKLENDKDFINFNENMEKTIKSFNYLMNNNCKYIKYFIQIYIIYMK